jgi:hypothetical protein
LGQFGLAAYQHCLLCCTIVACLHSRAFFFLEGGPVLESKETLVRGPATSSAATTSGVSSAATTSGVSFSTNVFVAPSLSSSNRLNGFKSSVAAAPIRNRITSYFYE